MNDLSFEVHSGNSYQMHMAVIIKAVPTFLTYAASWKSWWMTPAPFFKAINLSAFLFSLITF